MKSIANRLFVFAAGALFLWTIAYGQTTLKADVPFAFQTPGSLSLAGHYTIQFQNTGGGKIARIRNRETGQIVSSDAYGLRGRIHSDVAPRLVFRCGDGGCALSEIWTPTGGFSVPTGDVRNPAYTTSVALAFSQN